MMSVRLKTMATSFMQCFLVMVLLISVVSSTEAFSLRPSSTPEQIVESQLVALQKDDMQGVYEFASPLNKLQTGSVDRFSQMVRSGPYQYLIGHQKATILLSSNMAASQQFLVRVVPKDFPSKGIVEYWWSLSRCRTGPNAGCFLVDAVIPN